MGAIGAPVQEVRSAGERFDRLIDIMRMLRSPDGCPWDREQTQASLRPFVLEETYEVLEAIESGSPADLCEELGDFLFEAVFLAQIADERGEFTIADAIDSICNKLIRRHPHVFARVEGEPSLTPGQVIEKWEALKAREREAAGLPRASEGTAGESRGQPAKKPKTTLSGVPKTLPSLLRAYEVSARAAAVGFDWAKAGDVVDKIEEEVAELRAAVASEGPARTEEEMGDLLFAMANLSRKLGIEPEAALRRANDKFTSRFDAVEQAFAARNQSLSAATLEEMEAEWQRVKAST